MSLPITVATFPDPIIAIFICNTFEAMNVQKNLAIRFFRTKLNLLSLISRQRAGSEAFRLFCTPLSRYTGRQAEVFKNGEQLGFELNGKKIRGFRCNPAGTKRILILHGFSSSCHKFDKYATELIKKNYEVLAFDAPAHGASDGKTVNAVEYSEMINKIAELYGPIDSYIAHSFGGIAVSLALENMEHNEKTKLVLIAPATETESAIDGALKMLGIRKQLVRECLNDHIFRVSGKQPSWFSIRRAMKNIKAAVLWVHDEDDMITPIVDVIKVKEDNLPQITFMLTRGLGHQKIYRDPTVKNAILNFL
jgi:pimeloyl-ACP methyl ester carboxylesterase